MLNYLNLLLLNLQSKNLLNCWSDCQTIIRGRKKKQNKTTIFFNNTIESQTPSKITSLVIFNLLEDLKDKTSINPNHIEIE